MNRYIKYSKNYRISIAFLVGALATAVWIVIAATYLYPSPIAIASMFFVPSGVAVALMSAIYYWYKGENSKFGWTAIEEQQEQYHYKKSIF
jgi:hypothetical protein